MLLRYFCPLPERAADGKYDHLLRLGPHPLLNQCQEELNEELGRSTLLNDLDMSLLDPPPYTTAV